MQLFELVKDIKNAFAKADTISLKDLADLSVKNAVLLDSSTFAEISSIAYALYKILTKRHIVESGLWKKAKKAILNALENARIHAEEQKEKLFLEDLKKVTSNIYEIDEKLGHYVQNLLDKSRIKQASAAYAYGASLSKAASLFNVLKKDLQEYIGKTTLHDEIKEKFTIGDRLKRLKELLGERN
ncbi:hypothetical protein DRJ19_00280 [Candidatus Woesearchaeota archaeon]|nr:MAG: hypothetical protein DRJ19_00280 [Candidatus Woesearchaeota archaeon]